MRVIICGSRGFTGINHLNHLEQAMEMSGFNVTHVLHGANYESADALAEKWAKHKGVPFTPFPMENGYEMKLLSIPYVAAGPRRNTRMLKANAEAVVALWDGVSTGTADMIRQAKRAGVPGFLYRMGNGGHEHWPNQLSLL